MKPVLGIESLLTNVVTWVIKYPRASLVMVLFSVLLLGLGLSRLTVDVTNESMFHHDDPSLKHFQQFQTQFGRDDVAIAAIESPHIFSEKFLTSLEAYQQDLEANLPYLDKITSLVSATSVSDQDGNVLIDDLKKIWPTHADDYSAFKTTVLQDPLYRKLLVSQEGHITLMTIRANVFVEEEYELIQPPPDNLREKITYWHDRIVEHIAGEAPRRKIDTPDEHFFADVEQLTSSNIVDNQPLSTPQLQAFIRELKSITAKHQKEGFHIRLLGGNIIADEHVQSIHVDFASLLPITFLLVFILLLVLLRRIGGALIPLLIVTLTLVATMGMMGWLGLPVTPVTVALPPLLLTIGVADSVHILTAFYSKQSALGKERAIIYATQRTGVAILVTSLTTIAGFLAFVTAEIKPIADFGLLVGVGVLLAFVLSMILIPAILQCQSVKSDTKVSGQYFLPFIKPMLLLTQLSLGHAKKVLLVVGAVIALSIPGILQLQFSHNTLEWFPEGTPVQVNTYWLDKAFSGTIPFEIVVDTGKKNGLYDPIIMQKLEAFQSYAESLSPQTTSMGRATSVVDTLKRIHWALHQQQPQATLPNTPELVAQELLLFEASGADDVSELIDSDFSMARITARLSWVDAVDYLPIREQLLTKAQQEFASVANVWATGSIDLMSRTLVNIIKSMSTSYMVAAGVIALMLIALMRSISLGLVSLIPNFLPIVMSLGVMGYIGIPLDMFTVLLGGIALGLAVDDTVHFLHGYRYHRQTMGLSISDSVRETVITVGPALLFTTIAMAMGFFAFMFSQMQVVATFGLLLALTIINALLLDLLVIPALVKVLDGVSSLGLNHSKNEIIGE